MAEVLIELVPGLWPGAYSLDDCLKALKRSALDSNPKPVTYSGQTLGMALRVVEERYVAVELTGVPESGLEPYYSGTQELLGFVVPGTQARLSLYLNLAGKYDPQQQLITEPVFTGFTVAQ